MMVDDKPLATKSKSTLARKKKLHLRTRELMRFHCRGLELDIMNLKQEIATLELSRKLLYARTLNRADTMDGSFVRTVQQFYKLLHNGFSDLVWTMESGDRPLDSYQFVRAAFEEVMAVGPDLNKPQRDGRDTFVSHLIHMTALTGTPNVQLLDTRIYPSHKKNLITVEVKTVCSSPLSVLMLEQKFAHVSLYPELKNKLVGRQIHAYGDARYVFNTKTGRIIMADLQVDHAAAILQLVDTSEDYEILFGGKSEEALAQLIDVATTSSRPPPRRLPSIESILVPPESASPPPNMSLSFVLSPESPSPSWTDEESIDGDAKPEPLSPF